MIFCILSVGAAVQFDMTNVHFHSVQLVRFAVLLYGLMFFFEILSTQSK